MNGGYVMIDCTGLDLTKGSTPQSISGIYNKTKEAIKSNKPMYAYNCVWDDKFVSPIQCFGIIFDDNDIIVTSSVFQIVITTSDSITIRDMTE